MELRAASAPAPSAPASPARESQTLAPRTCPRSATTRGARRLARRLRLAQRPSLHLTLLLLECSDRLRRFSPLAGRETRPSAATSVQTCCQFPNAVKHARRGLQATTMTATSSSSTPTDTRPRTSMPSSSTRSDLRRLAERRGRGFRRSLNPAYGQARSSRTVEGRHATRSDHSSWSVCDALHRPRGLPVTPPGGDGDGRPRGGMPRFDPAPNGYVSVSRDDRPRVLRRGEAARPPPREGCLRRRRATNRAAT